MKKISLLLLSITAGFNMCGAMASKNKITNPAIVVAALKLQAKPILFFNTERINVEREWLMTGNVVPINGYSKLVRASESLEMNDIDTRRHQADQEYRKASQECQTNKITDEHNAIIAQLSQQETGVLKKIRTIKEAIDKRFGACAVFEYVAHYNDIICVDPAYDITQEVFDTLNKEYKESKSQKAKCNHCSVHCPHNNKLKFIA